MEISKEIQSKNDFLKVAKLLSFAFEIEFNFDDSHIDVNTRNGHIYIWSEYEIYTPFVNLSGDLKIATRCHNCNDEEIIYSQDDFLSDHKNGKLKKVCENCKEMKEEE
jgi:hypothetical protein